ncbi:MAG: hypothetical protein R2748_09850 [Bryobacterales bacterium]
MVEPLVKAEAVAGLDTPVRPGSLARLVDGHGLAVAVDEAVRRDDGVLQVSVPRGRVAGEAQAQGVEEAGCDEQLAEAARDAFDLGTKLGITRLGWVGNVEQRHGIGRIATGEDARELALQLRVRGGIGADVEGIVDTGEPQLDVGGVEPGALGQLQAARELAVERQLVGI